MHVNKHPNSNTVLENLDESIYSKVRGFIAQSYVITSRNLGHGVKESFEINPSGGRVIFIYYNNRKLLIQSSPSNGEYISLVQKICEISSIKLEQKDKTLPTEEHEVLGDFYLGCDESGAGESFGSLFFGCALISKENLEIIRNLIDDKNIRKLERDELLELKNATCNKFSFSIKKYTPAEIDANSKNILLDRGYIDLIGKATIEKDNIVVIIDDYGIKQELRNYVKSLDLKGIRVIVKPKADEEYIACKLASLVARCARTNEIQSINNQYSIVDVKRDLYQALGRPLIQ